MNEVLDLNTNISKSLSIKGVASAPALLYACVAGLGWAVGWAGFEAAGLGWDWLGWVRGCCAAG